MIFEREEFDNLSGHEMNTKAAQIKKRFDQKRNYFRQMQNQVSIVEHWDELYRHIAEFDVKFEAWNNKWSSMTRSNGHGNTPPVSNIKFIQHFEQGEELFGELNEFVISLTPFSDEEKLRVFKEELLIKIESDVLNLASSVNSKIEEGINDVIGLKSELGLEKNFGENITTELTSSNNSKENFRLLFIGCLMLIPVFLIGISYYKESLNLEIAELYTIKLGILFALTCLSYFFFSQYKLYQMMNLRYSHLNGFLGGGATYLARLVGTENEDVKKEINKKMADLFMQLDDISGLVKKSSHPAEVSLDKLGKLFEQMSKLKK